MTSNLDAVEYGSGGLFVYVHDGAQYRAPDPAAMPFQEVLRVLRDGPDLPRPMAQWKQTAVLERWSAHYDLPSFQEAQRLTYLIDRYRSAIAYDLHHWCGVDLGELWRARRWRTLLDLIDHLPGWSWYSASVADDEEHAKMIAEAVASRAKEGEKTPKGPPLHTWTPEVSKLSQVLDAVRLVGHYIVATNSERGKQPAPPKADPRPMSPLEVALQRAEQSRRQESHDRLTKRLLPHKR